MTANTFFGLTTASELKAMTEDRDYWRKLLTETNNAIERFQQENNQLKKDLEKLEAKHTALKQELKERNIWVDHLEGVNKEQVALIEKLQKSLTKALDEASQAAMLHNEATVKITELKLENQRYRETVQMAIDNLALEIK